MNQFSVRLLSSLCVAASALAVALPAQAAFNDNIKCTQSEETTGTGGPPNGAINQPFYVDCRGPKVGMLDGSNAEVASIISLFASEPSNPSLNSLTYKGKSNDASSSQFGLYGPFSEDPAGNSSGILKFDDLLRGVFVVGLQGGLPSNENYSYYLFDTNQSLSSTPGITMLSFDTLGIVRSDNTRGGGPLEFATLYTLQPAQGGTVPEPAGIVLATVAFGALALTTRRRRS